MDCAASGAGKVSLYVWVKMDRYVEFIGTDISLEVLMMVMMMMLMVMMLMMTIMMLLLLLLLLLLLIIDYD